MPSHRGNPPTSGAGGVAEEKGERQAEHVPEKWQDLDRLYSSLRADTMATFDLAIDQNSEEIEKLAAGEEDIDRYVSVQLKEQNKEEDRKTRNSPAFAYHLEDEIARSLVHVVSSSPSELRRGAKEAKKGYKSEVLKAKEVGRELHLDKDWLASRFDSLRSLSDSLRQDIQGSKFGQSASGSKRPRDDSSDKVLLRIRPKRSKPDALESEEVLDGSDVIPQQ